LSEIENFSSLDCFDKAKPFTNSNVNRKLNIYHLIRFNNQPQST